jgi:hypothetical protein
MVLEVRQGGGRRDGGGRRKEGRRGGGEGGEGAGRGVEWEGGEGDGGEDSKITIERTTKSEGKRFKEQMEEERADFREGGRNEGTGANSFFQLMEFGNVTQIILDYGNNFTWPMRLRIALDTARGLEYMHSKSLLPPSSFLPPAPSPLVS